MKGSYNGGGYHQMTLISDKKGKRNYQTHVVVAMTYLADYEPGLQVNHKDGNKRNNHVSNLEMVTASKNQRSYRTINNNNTSGYRGAVYYKDRRQPWKGQVRHLDKVYHCGYYATKEQAAFARDLKAVELKFEREAMNFPENWDRYQWELTHREQLTLC